MPSVPASLGPPSSPPSGSGLPLLLEPLALLVLLELLELLVLLELLALLVLAAVEPCAEVELAEVVLATEAPSEPPAPVDWPPVPFSSGWTGEVDEQTESVNAATRSAPTQRAPGSIRVDTVIV
jgi:hypothetical protein